MQRCNDATFVTVKIRDLILLTSRRPATNFCHIEYPFLVSWPAQLDHSGIISRNWIAHHMYQCKSTIIFWLSSSSFTLLHTTPSVHLAAFAKTDKILSFLGENPFIFIRHWTERSEISQHLACLHFLQVGYQNSAYFVWKMKTLLRKNRSRK